jgi:hypothetical protein
MSFLSISPCHDHEWTPSTVYTKYNIRQVQHIPSAVYTKYSVHLVLRTTSTAYSRYNICPVQRTLSTVSTQDCLPSLHSHDYKLTPECTVSLQRTSLHDRPPADSSPWKLKGRFTLVNSHVCQSTNCWIDSQHLACCPSTASKYTSNILRSRPQQRITNLGWLTSWNLHDRGLQLHLPTRWVMACKLV